MVFDNRRCSTDITQITFLATQLISKVFKFDFKNCWDYVLFMRHIGDKGILQNKNV